jgi:S1-C subfamily serine protease
MSETSKADPWSWILPTLGGVGFVLFLLYRLGWLLLVFKIALWLGLLAALVVGALAAFAGFSAPTSDTKPDERRQAQIVAAVSAVVVFVVGVALVSLPKSGTAPGPGPVITMSSKGGGLPKDSLKLATVTLSGTWEEEDVFVNDPVDWRGTAFVTEKSASKLLLFTNSHCLALGELAMADSDSDVSVEVLRYSVYVTFPSGATRPVLRIAEEATDLDLACLEVSADGLKEGRDYLVVPDGSDVEIGVGDRVIAIGTPLDRTLAGTHTFGNVSAIRDRAPSGERCRVIQHDAAINPGNSGGPLFLERDNRVHWIGVNTWGVAQGIYFSIAAAEAKKAKYVWAPANPSGAAKLISELRKVPATVSPRAR